MSHTLIQKNIFSESIVKCHAKAVSSTEAVSQTEAVSSTEAVSQVKLAPSIEHAPTTHVAIATEVRRYCFVPSHATDYNDVRSGSTQIS